MYLTSNIHLKYVIPESWDWHIHQCRSVCAVPPVTFLLLMFLGQIWILEEVPTHPWQHILARKSQNCCSHHILPPAVTLSTVNCYVAKQQVTQEAPSRERWIRDTVDYTPPEGIMNEAPKEYEESHKIRTEILVTWKETFPVKSCTPVQSTSGETLYCASRRCSTDLKAKSQEGK